MPAEPAFRGPPWKREGCGHTWDSGLRLNPSSIAHLLQLWANQLTSRISVSTFEKWGWLSLIGVGLEGDHCVSSSWTHNSDDDDDDVIL